jgi:GNAT superfamily N-acetyltransferase
MVVRSSAVVGERRSPIGIRQLAAGERQAVLEVFRGLSDRSRRLRFHGAKPALPDRDLDELVRVGCCGREAVAAVEVASGRAVGVARFVREPGTSTAEIAFAVVDEWQGRGIGRALVAELASLARREGIERVRASVVAGNDAAVALVRGLGTVVSSTVEGGTLEILVALPPDVQAFSREDRRGLAQGASDLGAEGRGDEADR